MNKDALYASIGGFLAEHGLWPSPENYALVYQLFEDEDSAAAQAVKAVTSDGVRLSQREANAIMDAHGLATPRSGDAESAALLNAARRQLDDFAAIVEASEAQAKSYGRDLAEGAARLEDSGDTGSVATLITITRRMVERTKAAEQQLAAARTETRELRTKLAEVEEEARSDPLTRLPNRRAFEERLAELQEAGGPLSLAICDIDNFKRVNDQYGHGVGDRVLRTVASLLQTSCAGHLVARLGGEEFVVLFEGLEPPEAATILDETREMLAAKQFKLRETDAPIGRISFSAGIACGSRKDVNSPLHRADTLLYEAKKSGRNRVEYESC